MHLLYHPNLQTPLKLERASHPHFGKLCRYRTYLYRIATVSWSINIKCFFSCIFKKDMKEGCYTTRKGEPILLFCSVLCHQSKENFGIFLRAKQWASFRSLYYSSLHEFTFIWYWLDPVFIKSIWYRRDHAWLLRSGPAQGTRRVTA